MTDVALSPPELFAEGASSWPPRADRWGQERGAAMVEFVLVLPVLLLIVVGILFFGRFLNYTIDETHLANEAARWAAVNGSPQGCSGTLAYCMRIQASPELLNGSSDVTSPASVCIQPGPGGTGQPGDPVTATVTATFHFLPFLGVADIHSSESATMRIEQAPGANDTGCSP